MCTAINLRKVNNYFGRNLDLEYHYNEEIVITPSNYLFPFRSDVNCTKKYPIIGIATVIDKIPLYYDAANIHGLAMAGLNFPGNAIYHPCKEDMNNIAAFEFIPWILRQCRTVKEARSVLRSTNITSESFSENLKTTDLHWFLSDSKESVVIEPSESGLRIYDNITDVLTNNPPYPYHVYNLCNYLNLTNSTPSGNFARTLGLQPYSNGMGGIGLPGDSSSASRFVRAAFMLSNSTCDDTEESCVSQFFHILDTVAHIRGSVLVGDKCEITQYSCCCNTTKGIYYYKTYENARIIAVDMYKTDFNDCILTRYPLFMKQDILMLNH